MSVDWESLKPALTRCPIIPVLSIEDDRHAVPLFEALTAAGITTLEVTLRTHCALDVLSEMAERAPDDIVIGAGTVISPDQIATARDAGARFAASPGAPSSLLEAGRVSELVFIPGITTPTEAMMARDMGYRLLKFFPAVPQGGAAMLESMHTPLPDLSFCPTGGINSDNLPDYLRLPNVAVIGGSWMVPGKLLSADRYGEIEDLARDCVQQARSILNSL